MNGRLYQRDIERLPVTGKQIRVARVGLGIKLKELAAAARVSPTTLNKIENGANAYEKTLLRLRGELERRGARFRVEGEMSWVRFPTITVASVARLHTKLLLARRSAVALPMISAISRHWSSR